MIDNKYIDRYMVLYLMKLLAWLRKMLMLNVGPPVQ